MAKLSLRLDVRKALADGRYPLKIAVAHNHATSLIPTHIFLKKNDWDERMRMVVKCRGANELNATALSMLTELEERLEKVSCRGKTCAEVRDALLISDECGNFLRKFESFARSRKTEGNRGVYDMCLACMRNFDSNLDSRTFEEIDKRWLSEFDAFLSKTQKINTRSIRMRCIRAVFNDAIDDGLTASYPFRKFKIRQEETKKRSLTVEELRMLRDFTCESWQVEYRDMFMLMFYLMGINAADLFQAKKNDLVDGRLEYRRQKTHRLYSIKVEPEAMAIIGRYEGKNYLISPLDRYANYSDYLHHLNDGLKSIGRKTGKQGKVMSQGIFPELSSYWSRHTCATLAAEIGISTDVIAQMLGHYFGYSTTEIYIKRDMRLVDEANRRLIDYVNHKTMATK